MIQATARVLAMTVVVITVASVLYMVTRFSRQQRRHRAAGHRR